MNKKILSLTLAGLLPVTFCHSAFAETTISALIEAEAAFTNGEDSTGITVELGIDHKINDTVDGHILFLSEEGEYTGEDQDVIIEEAVINLHPNDTIDISIGRQYVPFGNFDSSFISDPITLDLAETLEEALLISKKIGGFSGSAYLFDDDSENANGDIDNYGINLTYENDRFSVGAAYISDVVDTSVSGFNLHGKATLGQVDLIAEYIMLDDIADLNPEAIHLELNYGFGNDKTLSLTYQETSDAQDLELPDEIVGIAYSMPVYKNTSITAEYINSEGFDGTDDDTFNLQLAFEF